MLPVMPPAVDLCFLPPVYAAGRFLRFAADMPRAKKNLTRAHVMRKVSMRTHVHTYVRTHAYAPDTFPLCHTHIYIFLS